MSNRRDRRALNKKAAAQALAREEKRVARNRRTLKSIVSFLKGSIENPDRYIKTTNRIYLLRCLGNIMDSIVQDIDDVLPLSDFDTPSRNLAKKVSDNLDTLLDRLRDYSIKAYGQERLGDGLAEDSEYDDLTKVSYSLQTLMELYLIYFIDTEDQWRLRELDKFFKDVIPESATKAKEDEARAKLIGLYGEKIKMIEAALASGQDNNAN